MLFCSFVTVLPCMLFFLELHVSLTIFFIALLSHFFPFVTHTFIRSLPTPPHPFRVQVLGIPSFSFVGHSLVHFLVPFLLSCFVMLVLSFATHALARSHVPFLYSCAVHSYAMFTPPTPWYVPMPLFLFMRCANILLSFRHLRPGTFPCPFSVLCMIFFFFFLAAHVLA